MPVLKEHSLPLVINNISAIRAEFKLFIEAKDSVFSVEPRQAALESGESLTAHVLLKMDEPMDFNDVLHVLVQEGADMAVQLSASGERGAAERCACRVARCGYDHRRAWSVGG